MFPQGFTLYRIPSSGSPRRASFPRGKLLYRAFGCPVYRYAPGKLQENLPLRGRGTARRRWMRRGTAFRIAGAMGAEVERIEKAPLALPLGELSPQVTERALQRLLNNHVHLNSQRWPSQSRLCRASSPKGRAKGTFLRIRLQFLEYFTLPRGPHQARPGEPASPEGSSCTVLLGVRFIGTPQGSSKKTFPFGEGGPPAGGG